MAVTTDSIIDSIEVLSDGQIQVRRADRFFNDGVQVAKAYHRHVVVPGQNLALEDAQVAAVGAVVHTAAVIAAYEAAVAAASER